MAIDQGTETMIIASQERTWRVNIETAKGEDPVVTVWREVVRTAPDGSVISRESAGDFSRSLSEVAAETITVPGSSPAITLTMAQLAAAIAATADQWRLQDIAAAEGRADG